MITFDYKGKVALVTGSSRGIGYATAKMLLDAGAKVMINGSNKERLDAALKSFAKYKGNIVAHKADLKSRAEIEGMFKALIEKWGGIDILVNNAADRPVMKIVDMTDDIWDRNMNTKLRGALHLLPASSAPDDKAGTRREDGLRRLGKLEGGARGGERLLRLERRHGHVRQLPRP